MREIVHTTAKTIGDLQFSNWDCSQFPAFAGLDTLFSLLLDAIKLAQAACRIFFYLLVGLIILHAFRHLCWKLRQHRTRRFVTKPLDDEVLARYKTSEINFSTRELDTETVNLTKALCFTEARCLKILT